MTSRPTRSLRLALGALAVLLALALFGAHGVRRLLWAWESNPLLRGRLLAAEVGCDACHRPFAGKEIPNPGSRWGSVPRFGAGNAFMYGAEDRAGIEQYIRHGRSLDRQGEELEQRIVMPGYEDRLDDAQIADLVSFTARIEGIDQPGGVEGKDAAASDIDAGRALARRHGCFSCHGVDGSGGLPNPGSLGGFIPGFLGRNFEHLVEDEAELREWVLDGSSSRLEANPLIRRVWQGQTLRMPAYRDQLDDADVAKIWAFIQASRAALAAP